MKNNIDVKNIFLQTIHAKWLYEKNISFDVLRLDALHTIVSGNKWFKLKYYLKDALQTGFKKIATFGGAYSNHIVAAAFACKEAGFKSLGIIRGEEANPLSHTLQQATMYGMELKFVSRAAYRQKEIIKAQHVNFYWIDEGGYGELGVKGAAEIFSLIDNPGKYSHIVCAVGTGTTMAGLISASPGNQKIIGISVMKGNNELEKNVEHLLNESDKNKSFEILHTYHFGGYAKFTNELLQFMRDTWNEHKLPTDFVYTAKGFYAAQDLITHNHFTKQNNILFIHSGGLQGNYSLPDGILPF